MIILIEMEMLMIIMILLTVIQNSVTDQTSTLCCLKVLEELRRMVVIIWKGLVASS